MVQLAAYIDGPSYNTLGQASFGGGGGDRVHACQALINKVVQEYNNTITYYFKKKLLCPSYLDFEFTCKTTKCLSHWKNHIQVPQDC